MRRSFVVFCPCLTVVFFLVLRVGPLAATPNDRLTRSDSTAYERWYTAIRRAAADPQRGATVQNLTLKRDVATIELIAGDVHLLQAIDGHTFGAVFVGRGRFLMTPPVQIERDHLRRFFEAESLVTDIRSAVFFFTDVTDSELTKLANLHPQPPTSAVRGRVQEALDYLSDGGGWVDRDLMIPLLNRGPGYFYVHLEPASGRDLMFAVNPYDAEEVSLSRRATGKTKYREVVTQFHKQSDYETGSSIPQEGLDLIQIPHYEIESTIKSNLDFSAAVKATLKHVVVDHEWIPLRLFYDLQIDSILWPDRTPVVYYRGKETQDLWIDLTPPGEADSVELSFYYHGKLLERYRDLWVQMRSTTTWYPVYEFWRPATHRLTFHAPERFKVATVGKAISSTVTNKEATSIWETPAVRQVTFNIGEFKERQVSDPRVPNLTVQIDENAHNKLGNMAADANVILLEQRGMAEAVMTDLGNSFAFFNDVYGPTMVDAFTATETPYSHGEAYPGLVLLSWRTFQWTTDKGFDEIFRAHEVAHQWWGIGVHPATYHDRWLSEGFSDFSGLWYMGRSRGSAELFMKRLKETREAILQRRDKLAPVWLGTRAGNSDFPDDYQTVVYQKGAWVLHMLRNFFLDPDTGDDARFTELMKEFYTTYLGQPATTEEFRAMVEEHAGMPMDWFFDQWVYHSAIPTYYFSYKLDELANGEQRATVRVRQEKVPDDFTMIVPVLLDFGPAGYAEVRLTVTGPVTEKELPILPMKPVRIEFNPHESVLAETKTESWRNR
jgi:Peptidase family M1 domain